jgi:D-alanine transaminase
MGLMHRMRAERSPPGRIAWVDGVYAPHSDAAVHIEDRGLQFADAVYEVCAVQDGRVMDEAPHLKRLRRSMSELGMDLPMSDGALKLVLREVARRNRLKDGFLYLQVTRGAATRDHAAPAGLRPSLIVTARRIAPAAIEKRRATGVAVVTVPETRWARCDIKSTALLPNVLAKTEAKRRGGFEAWFVDRQGFITEGSSTNAWIVNAEGEAITRALTDNILPGVTRAVAMEAASGEGLAIVERAFTRDEAYGAAEAFLTSATGGVMPVVTIDGRTIGEGRPGPVAARLQALYAQLSGANAST